MELDGHLLVRADEPVRMSDHNYFMLLSWAFTRIRTLLDKRAR